MLNVIIFGAPGSGKGTQGEKIAEKYNLTHLSTGDLIRNEIHNNTHFGVIVKGYIDRGELVPDDTILEMLDVFLEKQPVGKGILFDGFPRTLAQAEALNKVMEDHKTSISVLIDLNVDRDELIDRLVKRGETSGRSDDNLETIKKRLEVYEDQTKPSVKYYKTLNLYQAIKGVGSIDDIFANICSVLDEVKV